MENLKIRVANEAESKEAQELFFELGFGWRGINPRNSIFAPSKLKEYFIISYAGTRDMQLGGVFDNSNVLKSHKEITIQQLRDLVVLKRNSVGDATHKCLWDVNPEYYIDSKGSVYFYKRELDTSFWVKTVNSKDWCDKNLEPIKEEVMKEYLEKQADGSYKLVMRGIVGKDDGIEVPEGADCARSTCDGLEFYRDNLNLFFSISGDCWKNTISSKEALSQNIVWQRHTQPEELPFVDDEPKEYLREDGNGSYILELTCKQEATEPHAKHWIEVPVGVNFYYSFASGDKVFTKEHLSLGRLLWQRKPPFSINDQYAEIEQVRQSGMKFDSNKPRHSLLPKGAVNSVIKVLEFGAKKYDADNWQKVDNAEERYYNAAMRHIDSWWNGEKCDPETGSHHLAHAATNLFFLMWFDNK